MFDQSYRIRGFDDELADAIDAERERQEIHIELIASENYASPRVMEAQGSVLTNKYAEGYPGKRYYGGCEYVDVAENLARDRAKELYDAGYANVQPHSGSQANAAVYHALLNPGDTILGMGLNEGGHLTHGSPVNFSGKLYNAVQYGINIETGMIDYGLIDDLAQKHKPKMLIGGFSAYSRRVAWERMRELADSVGPVCVSHDAMLLENHGAVALGDDPMMAVERLETVERLAEITWLAESLGGVRALSREQVDRLRSLRPGYGSARPLPDCRSSDD